MRERNTKPHGLAAFRRMGMASIAGMIALHAGQALATNGYAGHGFSAAQQAMGGASTAMVEDALISTMNPAGMAFVGDRLDFTLSLFTPVRDYSAGPVGADSQQGIFEITPSAITSDNDDFEIPGFSINFAIDDRQSIGFTMFGNGGLNTEYHRGSATLARGFSNALFGVDFETQCDGIFGGGQPLEGSSDPERLCGYGNPTGGIDLIQLFTSATYAYKLGEKTSIGISPIFVAQRLAVTGLGAFAKFSVHPESVSDNGLDYSYGYGGRIGFLTAALPGVGFGASYQTRIYMSEFDNYKGLLAQQGDFDIPSNFNIGLSLKPTANQRIAFDVQRIYFSEVNSVGNKFDTNDFVNNCAFPVLMENFLAANPAFDLLVNAPPKNEAACLGSASGPGFGWGDITVYKVGYQVKFGDLKLRAGYSKTDQPIPESEVLFNILAPAVINVHYTAGFAYQFSSAWGVEFAAMYAEDNPVTGVNPLSNTEPGFTQIFADLLTGGATIDAGADPNDQKVSIDMHQYMFTLGLSYRF